MGENGGGNEREGGAEGPVQTLLIAPQTALQKDEFLFNFLLVLTLIWSLIT